MASLVTIIVQLCNCSQRGQCVWDELQDGHNRSNTFQIVACDCDPLYDGDYCERTIDQCFGEPCGINGTCVSYMNETGVGYICTGCAAGGYKVSDDHLKCVDLNECSGVNLCNSSSTVCVNEPGTYHCDCLPGFYGPAGSLSCNDIDECELDTCDQLCTNLVGSYSCGCHSGYQLVNNTECVAEGNLCVGADCEQLCVDNDTSICGCRSGYTVNGRRCIDVNECLTTVNKCSPNANCVNTDGSYTCECPPGYMLLADQRTCDACLAGRWGQNCENYCRCEDCDSVVGCTTCGAIYRGWTGPNCDEDINECENATQYCGANSDCTNINGSFICNCQAWYQRLSGRQERCILLDACEYMENGTLLSSPRCANDGSCVNGSRSESPGSFDCDCATGFTGPFCRQRIDYCANHECVNAARCVNLLDGYNCGCINVTYGRFCQWRIRAAAVVATETTKIYSVTETSGLSNYTTTATDHAVKTDHTRTIIFSVLGVLYGIAAINVVAFIIVPRLMARQSVVVVQAAVLPRTPMWPARLPPQGIRWSPAYIRTRPGAYVPRTRDAVYNRRFLANNQRWRSEFPVQNMRRPAYAPNRLPVDNRWQGEFPAQNIRRRAAAPYRIPGDNAWRTTTYHNR